MQLETGRIVEQRSGAGVYRRLVVDAPAIAPRVRPGQFVHVRLPAPADALLRRPFSVFKTGGGRLEILYKPVGRGTEAMRALAAGDAVSLLGPLGNGFPPCPADADAVLVAGGYGMAALYLQARDGAARPGTVFAGGKTKDDILCAGDFAALGWTVRPVTEDGSLGERGLVTDALRRWLAGEGAASRPAFYACGPNGMLKAVGEIAIAAGRPAWLSIDRHMGCGVGACLTCVQKIRAPDGGWMWQRVCREGPVFECRQVVWEDESP
jgi:dihydroorotate dehydrogenase electron transfer subunit